MLKIKKDFIVTVEADIKMLKHNTHPNKEGLEVKLWDEDLFVDDFIGSTTMNDQGHVVFQFPLFERIRSWDSPFEIRPDLYIVVEKDGEEIYKSKVKRNINFHIGEDADPSVFKPSIHLGVYEIPDNMLS